MVACKWTEAELTEAAHLTEAGISVAEIARRKGVDKTNLYRLLRRHKLGFRLGNKAPPSWRAPESVADIGYLAGLFDGEGSLIRRSYESGGFVRFTLKIMMTDETVMRWCHGFGGSLNFVDRRHMHNRKDAWSWVLNRQIDIYNFLSVVRPYLKVKAQKADEFFAVWHGKNPTAVQ